MSTRAVYTFIDNDSTYHVYKHHDGYEKGALEFITKALKFAWELPRFEASEFSAAFVAANKTKGGDVYLTTSWEAHNDLSFRYEIRFQNDELHITAYYNGECGYSKIFAGTLKELKDCLEIIKISVDKPCTMIKNSKHAQ